MKRWKRRSSTTNDTRNERTNGRTNERLSAVNTNVPNVQHASSAADWENEACRLSAILLLHSPLAAPWWPLVVPRVTPPLHRYMARDKAVARAASHFLTLHRGSFPLRLYILTTPFLAALSFDLAREGITVCERYANICGQPWYDSDKLNFQQKLHRTKCILSPLPHHSSWRFVIFPLF